MPTNIDEEIQQLINELEELKIEFISKSDQITKKTYEIKQESKKEQSDETIERYKSRKHSTNYEQLQRFKRNYRYCRMNHRQASNTT